MSDPRGGPGPGGGAARDFIQEAVFAAGRDMRIDALTLNVTDAAPSAATAVTAPSQLPRDIPDFTGRNGELGLLKDQLQDAEGALTGVVGISGKPGVGKSALAIHLAHQVAEHFPDGQLYVNLRGPEQRALQATEVLGDFLQALGVPQDQVPATEPARATLFRTQTAGKRILLLLDNGRDAAQLRPLIPGSSSSVVIITSREALPTVGSSLSLGLMQVDEALNLLGSITGLDRLAAEPQAAREIVRLCGLLPLAVRITGARAAARPTRSLADNAARLSSERSRLSELSVDDLDVRASFDLSYRELDEDLAEAFRLLVLEFSPEIYVPRAAALLRDYNINYHPAEHIYGIEREVEGILERLVDAQLLDDLGYGHYRMHDLLRLFAGECLLAEVGQETQVQARERLLHWLRHMIRSSSRLLNPRGLNEACAPGGRLAGAPPDYVLDRALETFAEHRIAALEAIDYAAERQLWPAVTELAQSLSAYLIRKSDLANALHISQLAVQAAEASGDRRALAYALVDVAMPAVAIEDYDLAEASILRSIPLYEDFDERLGKANALGNLALSYHAREFVGGESDQYAKAIETFHEADVIFEEIGDELGRIQVAGNLAIVLMNAGQTDEAAAQYLVAMEGFRRVGDRRGLAEALRNFGVFRHSNQPRAAADAVRYLEESIDLFEQLGDLEDALTVAEILYGVHVHDGRQDLAEAAHERGIAIVQALNADGT